MAKKKADYDDDDFAPPANTGKAVTKSRKETVKVTVYDIAADGTRTITVGGREIILDADTTRISQEFFIDPETNMKKTVHVSGLYLMRNVKTPTGRKLFTLHEYIMTHHPNASQLKQAAVSKWHTTNLFIGHMDGDADNDNSRNLEWIPCELNCIMKRTNPVKKGKSWYCEVQVQGLFPLFLYVVTLPLLYISHIFICTL
jgi:hypothetical protein